MNIEAWTLQGAEGQTIFGDTHLPARSQARGVIVLSHGFKGYKDYGFIPVLAEACADAGYIAHRFNFSHSGMTNEIERFERPDLFEKDTWNKQVYDLTQVIEHRARPTGLPIVLFGHSRGGVTTVLTAPRLTQPVAGVIGAAMPDSCGGSDLMMRELMQQEGRAPSPSGRTGQMLYVAKQWLDEIDAEPHRHDPIQAVAQIKCPILLVHGEADETVSPEASYRLAAASHAEVELIEGAGHTFNAPNPMPLNAELPRPTRQMFDAVLRFIERVTA